MSRKKSKFSDEFKVKVVLEALKDDLTIAEIATKFDVIPKNIQNWREVFLANATLAINPKTAGQDMRDKADAKQKEVDELHRQIGQLNAQITWAKKKSAQAGLDYETGTFR